MFEKVNMKHPDKVADRIAGAIVDLCYKKNENPKVAVEVLVGHGVCHIIAETSEIITKEEVDPIVKRIAGDVNIDLVVVPQDKYLAENQSKEIRCGDNGIFKGVPLTQEEKELSKIAREIYEKYPFDGKYILNGGKLIICQSNSIGNSLKEYYDNQGYFTIVNPLGDWTGGPNVDSGATNRKLGSDMAQSVTGGGLMGKDYSKADVSVNIYCFLKAQETGKIVSSSCAIGDTKLKINIGNNKVETVSYAEIVKIAKNYINSVGGFEKFAEWGLL